MGGRPGRVFSGLLFPTEADAVAAFVQAERMYHDRADRRLAACERLGILDEEW